MTQSLNYLNYCKNHLNNLGVSCKFGLGLYFRTKIPTWKNWIPHGYSNLFYELREKYISNLSIIMTSFDAWKLYFQLQYQNDVFLGIKLMSFRRSNSIYIFSCNLHNKSEYSRWTRIFDVKISNSKYRLGVIFTTRA